MTAERDKWVAGDGKRRPLSSDPSPFIKFPKSSKCRYNEFDRNRFDQPVARVDRCQTCHLAINRAGFEKEPQPFRTHPGAKFSRATAPIRRRSSVARAVMKAKAWRSTASNKPMARSICGNSRLMRGSKDAVELHFLPSGCAKVC